MTTPLALLADPALAGISGASLYGLDRLALPFDQWLLRDAQEAVRRTLARTVGEDGYTANVLLAERGDHWRGGEGIPYTGDPAARNATLTRLQAEQAPTDTANEILDNAVNGLLGTEAVVTFVAREPIAETDAAKQADAAQQAAMHAALGAWWDRIGLWGEVRTAARRARWAMRGPLRVWIPPAVLRRTAVAPPVTASEGLGGVDPAASETPPPPPSLPTDQPFGDALRQLVCTAWAPNAAVRYVQPDTQHIVGVVLFARRVEAIAQPAAELWYLDADGRTVCRVLTAGTPPGASEDTLTPLPLGGRLPVAEATGALLLTAAARAQQDALDFDGIAGRVAIRAAGFRARATLNAKPTGVWTRTKPVDGPPLETFTDTDDVVWYRTETPLLLGPNTALQLTGETLEDTTTDASGVTTTRRTLATPALHTEEPVSPDFFIKAAEFRRSTMLRDASQGHLAQVANERVSGVAYVQARAAFAQDLENARGPLERALRDTLEVAIALADLMTAPGDPLKGFLDRYRVQVTARVNPGPLTADERKQFVAEWQAGAYALTTLQGKLGIEDPQAEAEALAADPMVQLAHLTKVAETLAALALIPGASLEMAGRALTAAGVDEALVTALLPQDTDGGAAATDSAMAATTADVAQARADVARVTQQVAALTAALARATATAEAAQAAAQAATASASAAQQQAAEALTAAGRPRTKRFVREQGQLAAIVEE